MKLKILRLAVALLCLSGCGRRSSAIPEGSFRITVADVFSSEDERVSTVTLETRESEKYSIRAKSLHLGEGILSGRTADTGLYRERVLLFISSRISPNGSEHDCLKYLLRRGEEVTTTDMREFPRGTPLARLATLTVSNGLYSLSRPLVIGQCHGEDLLLAVGGADTEVTKQ